MPMADTLDVDVAIVGGGCAGLALASRLAVAGGPSCVVLEAKPAFEDDRTWCFWDSGELARWGLVPDAAWDSWCLRLGDREIVHRSPGHRYVCVSARSFYETHLARIARAGSVRVAMDSPVARIGEDGLITLADASRLGVRARQVFDARPPTPTPGSLVQHFEGWEIETDDAVFDPSRVVLMDFEAGGGPEVVFLYVLPFSSRRALVEATVLSRHPWPVDRYRASILGYLGRRFGLGDGGFTVRRRERGVLPMEPARVPSPGPAIRIGSASGASKMSSGYAFPFIQAQVTALADAILAGGSLSETVRRNPLLAWMDGVFVDVLKRDPQSAPDLFYRMFRGTTGGRFARFMMEQPSPGDLLAVVASLPTLPFLRAAARRAA